MINKKNLIGKKASMSYLQICILIISTFAFAYILYSSIEPVNAAETDPLANYVCCAETNSGNACQFVLKDQCKPDAQKSPSQCENTEFCKIGCCYSEENGWCNHNTGKASCEGEWNDDASCNIQECTRGCCVLGNYAKFTTEKNCEYEAESLGIPIEFKSDVKSQSTCLYLTQKDDTGACILDVGDKTKCIYTTREDCYLKTKSENDFYANIFCSAPELNTTCTSHNSTSCIEGEQEVYWLDSCGNKEDVKEVCNVLLGTVCGQYRPSIDTEPDTGNYVCRDLSCNVEINGKTVNKKNGESWCEYEGCIGEGKDTVGSRHIKHICFMGEERIEACEDFRNQICVQSDTNISDGTKFSEASCRVNRWRSCYEYNNEQKGMAEKCAENPDCTIKGVHIDKFSFDVCVPNYPPGFEFWNYENPTRSGQAECALATQTCPVVYVKRLKGWVCEMNCDCEKGIFTQQMNELCTSLGDCGGYINFNGDYTDDGYSSGAGRLSGDQYKSCAEYQPNQKPAEPGNFGFNQILGIPEGVGEGEIKGPNEMLGNIGLGVGAVNVLNTLGPGLTAGSLLSSGQAIAFEGTKIISGADAVTAMEAGGVGYIPTGGGEIAYFPPGGGEMVVMQEGEAVSQIGTTQPGATGEGSFLPPGVANALAAVGAALSVGSFLQAGFGLDAGVSYAIGAVVGVATYIGLQAGAVWASWIPWIGIGLAILSFALGLGETKIKDVKFTCMPWQAPDGGDNCDKCNIDDELGVQCSEYRCKSLGSTCEFINPRTTDERCITNNPSDVSSPRISPLSNFITNGYKYGEVTETGFKIKTSSNECLPEYSIIQFGIETNKPARCKISPNFNETYDEMLEFFGDTNSLLTEHKMTLIVPSPSAFKNRYNLTDEEVLAMGQINYYVKCENINGNANVIPFNINSCVRPGPDLGFEGINRIIPPSGSFIKFNETEKDIVVYVNEPADCRWSKQDKDYSLMENIMECQTGTETYGLFGWPCFTRLTAISKNQSDFYIRCKDQPWLDDTNTSRNPMSESYKYSLAVSNTNLKIERFSPTKDEEITAGVEPVTVDLRIETSGGAEEGKAICEWAGNGYSDRFTTTNSKIHKYELNSATRGDYQINFRCSDAAGNVAEDLTSFKIRLDTAGPKIVRAYYESGLKIKTDEDAECRYDFDRYFKWENATVMSGNEQEHSAEWKLKTYYIQCADGFGNKGNKLNIKAYNLLG